MRDDGVKHALAFVTSAYSSYSGCRQYREDIAAAQERVGPGAPQVDKLRVFYNHPLFIDAVVDNVEAALDQFPAIFRDTIHFVFSAHSLPLAMIRDSRYVEQIEEAARLVTRRLNRNNVNLVYQSRSGPPSQPWLEPDICDYLHQLAERRQARNVCVVPIGFVSDHMEVIYDLDTEAQQLSRELGLKMVRASTVGTHPKFIEMIRELIQERMGLINERRAVGRHGPSHDICPDDCCPAPKGRPDPPESEATKTL
jgi:ferrochelatase